MLKRCTGWHTVGRDDDGEPIVEWRQWYTPVVEWRQWYTYDDSPCPEHGREFLAKEV